MKEAKYILETAINLAKKAGQIQLQYFRSQNFNLTSKTNSYDIVTTADQEAEKIIISGIRDLFPDHGILSEEFGSVCEEKDYRWVIDPLDGTTNFSQGLPMFSVSIAVEYKGESFVGVVYAPYLNELFYSIKGEGAYLNGKLIECSRKQKLDESVVSTGFPYDKRENSDNNLGEILKVTPKVRGLRRMGSAAIDLCYVAAGFFDAYWELNLKRWDVAAGILIAKEAGALVFPIRENRNHSILVSGAGIYKQILEILLTPNLRFDKH